LSVVQVEIRPCSGNKRAASIWKHESQMEGLVAVRPAENAQRLPFERVMFTYYGYLRWVTLEMGSVSYFPLTR